MPLVSFVVPCYNYGRYLPDCLDGILNQRGNYDLEVIAVNDGSPDDTIDILHAYNDPRLRVIDRRENKGHVFTVNEGLAAATGRYVVRVDPDDRHHHCFLEKTVPVLEADPDVALAYGNVNLIGPEGQLYQERVDTQHGGRDFRGNELVALLKSNFICAPTVIARRDAWLSAWPVPEHLAFNDWYFSVALARRWPFYYCNDVLADYRVHGANHHTKISRDGSEERSVLYLLDWIYRESESDTALEQAKRRAKSDVYASQYLDFALKYSGHGMRADTRRCLWMALRWKPTNLARPRVLRHLLGSTVPARIDLWMRMLVRRA